jgi:hypothetical protein
VIFETLLVSGFFSVWKVIAAVGKIERIGARKKRKFVHKTEKMEVFLFAELIFHEQNL